MDLPSPTDVDGMYWYLIGALVVLALVFVALFGALYLDVITF